MCAGDPRSTRSCHVRTLELVRPTSSGTSAERVPEHPWSCVCAGHVLAGTTEEVLHPAAELLEHPGRLGGVPTSLCDPCATTEVEGLHDLFGPVVDTKR
jgi:hypothetical protein